MRVIDSFVGDLESFLGTKRTVISLADMWRDSCPVSAKEKNLADYLKTVSFKAFMTQYGCVFSIAC